MKKIFIYLIVLIIICFSLPIIFTKEFSERTYSSGVENLIENILENTEVVESTYDYAKYNTIMKITKN